jgi:hypothetical protein
LTTDDLVKVNKTYFVKASTTALSGAVFTAFPYLNVPPFNFLIKKAIDWIVFQIADAIELASFFGYIDMRTTAEGKDYVDAVHNIQNAKTPEEKEQLDKIADEKFKALINFKS